MNLNKTRLNPEEIKKIKQASQQCKQSLSSFVALAAITKANKVLTQIEAPQQDFTKEVIPTCQ